MKFNKIIKEIYVFLILLFLIFDADDLFCQEIKYTIIKREEIYPKIALVLSGGGARGVSQIGAIGELEKAGIEFKYIIGTSIGALVGGLYSVGYTSGELDSIMRTTNWSDILSLRAEERRTELFLDQKIILDRSLLTLKFNGFKPILPEAISFGTKFNLFLQNLVWNGVFRNANFDSLKYIYRAVTTDLVSGKTISINSGNIVTAMRASSTVPLRFTPVRINDMVLVDGGIMANLPVAIAQEFNPDIIIAINTVSPLYDLEELDNPLNIADQAISVAMINFTELASKLTHFTITPEIGKHKNTDFSNFDILILKGQEAAKRYLWQIKELIDLKKDSIVNNILNRIAQNKFNEINEYYENKSLAKNFKNYEINDLQLLKDSIINVFNDPELDFVIVGFNEVNNRYVLIIPERNKLKQIIINSPISELSRNISDSLKKYHLNKIICNKNIDLLKTDLIKRLRILGYSFAEISEFKITEDNVIEIAILLGELKDIEIQGIKDKHKFLARRELVFKENQILTAKGLIDSWENLINSDYFYDAEINPTMDENLNGIKLMVKLNEEGNQTLRLGARVDNERNLQVGIDIFHDNLYNIGDRYTLRLVGGGRNFFIKSGFQIPRIFNTLLTIKAKAYYDWNMINNYYIKKDLSINKYDIMVVNQTHIERYGLRLVGGQKIYKSGTIEAEYRYEMQRDYFSDSSATNYSPISTLKIGTVFDSEDNSDFPTKGGYIEISLESSLLFPTIAASYSKAFYNHRFNFSYGIHTISQSMLFGFADKTLPFPEFFFIGGQNLFYGSREAEYRGRQVLKTSIDYRIKIPYKLFFDTYFSLRYDLGGSWIVPENIKLSTLRHGIGSSLMFDTPLGPALFSLGKSFYFVKDPDKVIFGPTLFYFSIGTRI